MHKIASLFLMGTYSLLTGACHSSELCTVKVEAGRLARDNAALRASTARLIEENLALKAKLRSVEDDDADPPAEVDPALFEEASAQLAVAIEAYVQGENSKAIRLALRRVDAEPARAWRLIGAARCSQRNRAGARVAFSRVDVQGRAFLTYVCSRNSIEL